MADGTPTPLALVVLAAGMGSRFGGDKQLEPVGPGGELLFDYSIRDARQAGIERVVMIVRTEIEGAVREHLARTQPGLEPRFVRQDELGPPRAKPWGTGHAILAAAPHLDVPFGIVNADDYYGPSSFGLLAELLRRPEPAGQQRWGIVGFRVTNTIPEQGAVTRGVCRADGEQLVEVVEREKISRAGDGGVEVGDGGPPVAPDDLVSMNLWAFTPGVVPRLQAAWERFLAEHGDEEKAEFLIPTFVNEQLADPAVEVAVRESTERWIGITYRDDIEPTRRLLAESRGD